MNSDFGYATISSDRKEYNSFFDHFSDNNNIYLLLVNGCMEPQIIKEIAEFWKKYVADVDLKQAEKSFQNLFTDIDDVALSTITKEIDEAEDEKVKVALKESHCSVFIGVMTPERNHLAFLGGDKVFTYSPAFEMTLNEASDNTTSRGFDLDSASQEHYRKTGILKRCIGNALFKRYGAVPELNSCDKSPYSCEAQYVSLSYSNMKRHEGFVFVISDGMRSLLGGDSPREVVTEKFTSYLNNSVSSSGDQSDLNRVAEDMIKYFYDEYKSKLQGCQGNPNPDSDFNNSLSSLNLLIMKVKKPSSDTDDSADQDYLVNQSTQKPIPPAINIKEEWSKYYDKLTDEQKNKLEKLAASWMPQSENEDIA